VQREALNWLAWDDPAEHSVNSGSNHVVTKHCLVLFYYASGGPEWHVERDVYVAETDEMPGYQNSLYANGKNKLRR
jgi:hypothetical protein